MGTTPSLLGGWGFLTFAPVFSLAVMVMASAAAGITVIALVAFVVIVVMAPAAAAFAVVVVVLMAFVVVMAAGAAVVVMTVMVFVAVTTATGFALVVAVMMALGLCVIMATAARTAVISMAAFVVIVVMAPAAAALAMVVLVAFIMIVMIVAAAAGIALGFLATVSGAFLGQQLHLGLHRLGCSLAAGQQLLVAAILRCPDLDGASGEVDQGLFHSRHPVQSLFHLEGTVAAVQAGESPAQFPVFLHDRLLHLERLGAATLRYAPAPAEAAVSRGRRPGSSRPPCRCGGS